MLGMWTLKRKSSNATHRSGNEDIITQSTELLFVPKLWELFHEGIAQKSRK